MAKLASLLLALSQITSVHSLHAAELKRDEDLLAARAITLTTGDVTTSYSTAIESMQTASATMEPSLTGSILTGLPSGGFTRNPEDGPGPTSVEKPLCPNETPLNPGPTAPVNPVSANIFQPIQSGSPPVVPQRGDHVVRKQHIEDGDVPIQTNKFHANFFLGSQGFSAWTHPYSLAWAKGRGESWGMAVSHTTRDRFAFDSERTPPRYFISPIGIQHIVLSAEELQRETQLSVERLETFSTYVNLRPNGLEGTRILMSLPVVQGMGMVTAEYDRAKPSISSGVFFRSLNYVSLVNGITHKYRIVLEDGSTWLLYATSIGSVGTPPFVLENSRLISGPANFVGRIQVTKNPAGEGAESTFDYSAGAYAINATISGAVNGAFGTYTLSWTKGGVSDRPLLMYALPHHYESFDPMTRAALKNEITLVTTTKGFAKAVVADRITMVEEDLPDTIGFAPWSKNPNGAGGGSENINVNSRALALINQAGIMELAQDMIPQTRLNSMYYSGKGLAKFAQIVYVMNSMTGNSQYAAAGLDRLKDAFNVFVNNTQPEPLVYDTVWKGVVSSATYRPPFDTGLDFGNTLYNDHHFHYGYFVWTAAVIGHLDPNWLTQGTNKAWVDTLVRDYANPVTDEFYPFMRAFDWFHGHSWAKGLYESGDGKDQESTSEDTFSTYALKMWGKITRDANMEARANLQLAVQARSLRNYFLLESDNQNQPPSFVPNKVTGILFENKVDHTTYFGGNIEYIQGIHMIPLNPSSAYTRSARFVQEEWDTYFSNGRAEQAQGGWKHILKSNQALIDAQASFNHFADPNFDGQLDGGASRTWYLAYSAALLAARTEDTMVDAQMNYTVPAGPEISLPAVTESVSPAETFTVDLPEVPEVDETSSVVAEIPEVEETSTVPFEISSSSESIALPTSSSSSFQPIVSLPIEPEISTIQMPGFTWPAAQSTTLSTALIPTAAAATTTTTTSSVIATATATATAITTTLVASIPALAPPPAFTPPVEMEAPDMSWALQDQQGDQNAVEIEAPDVNWGLQNQQDGEGDVGIVAPDMSWALQDKDEDEEVGTMWWKW